MSHAAISPHRVFLIDLHDPLSRFMQVLEDYCDLDYQDGGGMLTEQEIVVLTMNFLNIAHNTNEAIEAMSIQVNTYCKYYPTPYNKHRIYEAIVVYIRSIHRLFLDAGLYGDDSYLAYSFGGWHLPGVPLLVPTTHLRCYPQGISTLVDAEPVDPRPSRIFRTITESHDSYYKDWPLTPRATDILPY
jgi:hypothetical protein